VRPSILLAASALVAITPTVHFAHARGSQPADSRSELRTGLSLLVSASPDIEKRDAIPWLRRAADRGDVSAKFHLADVYWSSLDADAQDDRKALQLFLEVAQTGDPFFVYPAITYAHKIRTPTLVMTNMGDYRVTPTQAFKLYHALKDNGDGLRGLRVGVPRHLFSEGVDADVMAAFEAAISVTRDRGAEIVDVRPPAGEPSALDETPFDAPGEPGRADDEP